MFDYMVKVMPNGNLLVRDSHSKVSEVIKASKISDYFQKALKEQLEAEKDNDQKQKGIREGAFKL